MSYLVLPTFISICYFHFNVSLMMSLLNFDNNAKLKKQSTNSDGYVIVVAIGPMVFHVIMVVMEYDVYLCIKGICKCFTI
jgi:hypothetical protein